MPVHLDRATWLLSAVSAKDVSGTALDCRVCANYGFLFYKGTPGNKGESATFNLQGSPDGTHWTTIAKYTATGTLSATAQIAGYLPYVRAVTVEVYTATGAGGTATGAVSVFYAPGMQFG
jgi:hypothetical protein